MTTHNFLDAVKNVASQTEDDSLLGVTVRKLLQEVKALETMEEYDANPIFNTESFEATSKREDTIL
jgi:hypothetical protein